MLSELDGFEKNDSTIVLAATNRPDILDPALLRPGRFDRRITIGLPSMKDRMEILKIHADKKPLADDIDFERIAQGTPGFSGAELENLLNEAAILAARRREKQIQMTMIEEARDKVMMGLERRNLTITPEEKKIIAYHEAGHAVTAAALPNTDPLVKVTVIPRDYAMGVTVQMPKEERYIYDKGYLSDRIKVLLGGRSAEMLMFGKESSGAANDLKEASKLARRMVTEWGMGETLGLLTANQDHTNVFLGEQISQGKEFSEDTMREVDTEIRTLLTKAYDATNEILDKFRSALEQVAERLLEEEQISGEDVIKIVNEAAV
jgi:cell division protease FtsH